MPRAYPLVPRHENKGVRRVPHGDHLIFYRIGVDTVEILHVIHGARDYEAILFPDERAAASVRSASCHAKHKTETAPFPGAAAVRVIVFMVSVRLIYFDQGDRAGMR
jgi:hypothetical protein